MAQARAAVGRASALLRARGSTAATSMVMSSPINRGGFGQFGKPLPYYRQPELKCMDTREVTLVIDNTNQNIILNDVLQGAAFYNRIGNEIEMKSLHLTGHIGLSGTAPTPTWDYMRILVIYDRQPNGAFPTTADVLTSYDQNGTTSSTAYDHTNPTNHDRFKILADIRLEVPWNNSSLAVAGQIPETIIDYNGEYNINRFINLRGLPAKFKASAGNIGDLASGSLFLKVLGTQATAAAPFQFLGTARLRYID